MKVATLFSGGGILDAAIVEAGHSIELAVEGDPERSELSHEIADNYALNYGSKHLVRSPVERVNFYKYAEEDWFLVHASPSCKNFSLAKTDGIETPQDIAAAEGTAHAIGILQPLYFTLEQVRGYIHTQSFVIILNTLKNLNYSITYDVLNSYYYGVPQERDRLFVTACRTGAAVGLPSMSRPTSWGEVLGDRLPYMEPSRPTPQQKEALGNMPLLYPNQDAFLIQRRGQRSKIPIVRQYWRPAPTITCALFTDGKGANRKSFLDVYYRDQWLTLSIRDMAKLQTIPDWYILPEKSAIAGAIIGNGVPTKMYEAILKHIHHHYSVIKTFL